MGLLSLIIYPMQTTMVFQSQKGWERHVSLGFMVASFLILNKTLTKDLQKVFTSTLTLREAYIEVGFIFASALTNIVLFASLYHMYGVSKNGVLVKGDWIISIYFSVATWTTLGYGDFSPIEQLRLVAASEAMMGYFYMALAIGLILHLGQQSMKFKEE